MSNLKRNGQRRWAPSYLRRQGQMTRAQKRAWREAWPRYGLTFTHGTHLDLRTPYPEPDGPLLVEIGFGKGEHLVHLAREHPTARVLGIEMHRPGIASALLHLLEAEEARNPVGNLKLVRGDARLVLEDHLEASERLTELYLLFPDPWPKPGDAHRRFVQADLIDRLEHRFVPGGRFHLATDVEAYADHAKSLFGGGDAWEPVASPGRVRTRYEERGIGLGHAIHDVSYAFLAPS